ncbi:hypothetical protein [Candidatus Manganitrophus noduliformans]|uniref:Uncharacterized protein n=1 Tax=Candidatus Manganitrophus noduliformans TaxID=2606439 RepID=A0A7X6IBJ1_9BACT|nr:hypothetical protein [Candidatus Manganitrophus noduliformans]NKE71831.1 hypothetical protein [Candidatus Manganitrophus noduliformans]
MKLLQRFGPETGFGFALFFLLGALALIALHALFERATGKRIPRIFQAGLTWAAAYVFFRWILFPPIPSSLLYIYMAVVTVAVILLMIESPLSTEECKQRVVATILGETPAYRVAQAVTFVLIPFSAFLLSRYLVTPPPIGEPIELRVYHSAPPRSIEVHGEIYDLQTAKNPFREEEIPL